MVKKTINGLLIIIGLILIVNLLRDIYGLAQKRGEVRETEDKLAKILEEQKDLQKQLEYVNSLEFVEKEAREKLGLSKPGETVVFLPENIGEMIPKEEKPPEVPNWKKWGQLFGFFK